MSRKPATRQGLRRLRAASARLIAAAGMVLLPALLLAPVTGLDTHGGMIGPGVVMAADASPAVAVPAWLEAEIPKARLAGSGNFRYFGMSIYDADFWVGPNGYRTTAPHADRYALDLRYARALVGKRIAASSADEMKKLGLGSAEQRAAWQTRMEALFPDVQEGTRITGIYLPKHGARFYRDGKLLGEIDDPTFGAAFFAIWLDPKTTGGKLREALLADAAPR